MTTAFPLKWPDGYPRTPTHQRLWGQFKGDSEQIQQELLWEIDRLGGRYPVISSNAAVRRDGFMYAEQARKKLDDPGVAVYFEKDGKQQVFACDQYDAPWKNMRAIQKTIEAIRGIGRWGASSMMERALSAFQALPPPGQAQSAQWHIVLGVEPGATEGEIRAAYRSKARRAHPDQGGSESAMAELNRARDEALKATAA